MSPINERFPATVAVLSGTDFDRDLEEVNRIISQKCGSEALQDALDKAVFQIQELTPALAYDAYNCGCGWWQHELEAGLRIAIAAKGLETVRANWKSKLTARNRNAFQDALYEVLVCGRAIQILDPGTVEFEKPLANSAKNSDIYGAFLGEPLRIEVTVLHEDEPIAIDLAWIEEIEEAQIPTGFRVVLKKPVSSMEAAKSIRSIIERIHAAHRPGAEVDISVDGVVFRWDRGVYRSDDREKHVATIDVDHHHDLREVVNPCRTRRVTPRYIEDEWENPRDVFSVMPNGPNHNDNPLSGKVIEIVERKLNQLEDGVINVVALCHPRPGLNLGIVDALLGARQVVGSRMRLPNGNYKMVGNPTVGRIPRAPFCPKEKSSHEDYLQFSAQFEKLSGVWMFRQEIGIEAKVISNPNANRQMPQRLSAELQDSRSLESRWIAENAYFRWLKEGCPAGAESYYWLEAESAYRNSWRNGGVS
ncbi:MAG: DUF2934 domain-containing protein [Verrucomicrobiae bacterium]|nr:DUF2934 domain-containing protein [Verrucomicrobiae bacterium]